MGEPPSHDTDLAAIRAAFGCGQALAGTIAAMARGSAHERGALLWPLPDRDETSLLTAGAAQEVAYGRDGAMLVLLPIAPGDFYGALVAPDADAARVESLSEGAAAHFSGAAVIRLMESYSCVGVAITRHLAGRLAAMRQRMVEAAMLSATGRIAAELLRRSRAGPDRVIRPMPVFAELAMTVQSTRETVSRTISGWEKRGLVKRVDGGLEVVAPHRLEELVY
ncbi:MAG: Crp/Fnr family transcriptional regulator [Sphingomonadales bacterium]|nr:Crp/Fnr family transcriptional regulator [Sphingomonadales bacterium]